MIRVEQIVLQAPIGRFIVDFVGLEARLVIEADGGHDAVSGSDAVRDHILAGWGFAVARCRNDEILRNPEGVLADIVARLETRAAASRHPP